MEENAKLLSFLIENPYLSQRELSKKMEISLGKTNNILKKCIENKFVIKNGDNKSFRYLITETGEAYLKENLEKIKETKIMINEEISYSVREAVILAAGKRKDFDKPVGLLKVDENEILKRTISILKNNGIEKIVIICGYKNQLIKNSFEKDKNIICINNDKYKWTGTMYSLSLAKDYISDDFILVESDLVFERQAISGIIKNKNRDCLLITNESGSGDEAFVQLKNNYLFKMAKDIHQFNRIDGEMIGISKISYKLYNMMLKEFEKNINPYLNYEYMLLDISRDYKVKCLKIDDLIWGEIDNLEQYKFIEDYLYHRIKRKELEAEKEYIKGLLNKYLDIDISKIDDVLPAGGMTNRNYKIIMENEAYILRIPGAGTENMISRNNEMINSKLAADKGLNVDILMFDENKGIKISKFIECAETLTARTAKKEENMVLVADILRELHNSKINMENEFDVFKEIERYENILKQHDVDFYQGYDFIRKKVINLKNVIKEYSFKLVPSHNDTVPENFIKDKNGKMFLIDWEYSGLNDEMWDLAAHSLECGFNEEDDELFFRKYFKGDIDKDNKIKILINKILQDFLWSIWTLIKEAEGDDFGTYGIERYNRARKNIEILENLI